MTDLTAHFTAAELGADRPGVTNDVAANLLDTATWLETARSVLGVPLRITRGYSTPEENAAVGGVADSEHLSGLAADFVPVGLSKHETYQRLSAARDRGELPLFDELIYYVADDHLHVGLRPSFRGNVEVQVVEGGVKRYRVLTAELAAQLWGALPEQPGLGSGRCACAR
jgi:hypothetical protein